MKKLKTTLETSEEVTTTLETREENENYTRKRYTLYLDETSSFENLRLTLDAYKDENNEVILK